MSVRKTIGELAHAVLYRCAEELYEKSEDRLAGDETATFTEKELRFLAMLVKLELEGELTEAKTSVLKGLSDRQVIDYFEAVRMTVAQGEGLN